jgi:hypothetical protein
MGAGDVRPETVDTVVQALLAHDFGTHFQMAAILGWAVRERMVTETKIWAAFARYGCVPFRNAQFVCLPILDRVFRGWPAVWLVCPSAADCAGMHWVRC